jgi:hypothetical protein
MQVIPLRGKAEDSRPQRSVRRFWHDAAHEDRPVRRHFRHRLRGNAQEYVALPPVVGARPEIRPEIGRRG